MREGVPVGPGPRGSLDDRDGDRRSPCAPAAVDVHAALAAIVGDARVRRDASLAPYTTFRVGGRADWLAEARGETELVRLLAAAGELGLPVTMLGGGGSNVLVADEGVRGLVVRSWHGGVSEVGARGRPRLGRGDDQRAGPLDDPPRTGGPRGVGRHTRHGGAARSTATRTSGIS